MKASLEIDFKDEFMEYKSTTDGIILASSSLKSVRKSQWKEIYELMEKFIQSYIASTIFDKDENLTQDLLTSLQKRYHLHTFPYQIECVDISHFSGTAISGGLACMRE